jgi:protein-disulfide isomerase
MAWRPHLSTATDILSLLVIVAAALLLSGRLLTGGGGSPHPEPVTDLADQPISLVGVPIVGDPRASVVVLEFSDFECPYCRRHAGGTFTQLKVEFVDRGRIRYAFANNPLEAIHSRAKYLAMVGMCADRQGLFWETHDAMFAREKVSDDALMAIVAGLKLDSPRLLECLSEPGGVELAISRQSESARQLGLDATPGFVIGRVQPDGRLLGSKRIRGAQPIEVFRRVLEQVIIGR